MTILISQLHTRINTRGYYEQERGYLFGGLYPNAEKKVTRRFAGLYRQFDNHMSRSKSV